MSEEKNKKGLGRGLMSLFGDQDESTKKQEGDKIKKDFNNPYLSVSIGDLKRNRFQPRTFFDNNKLQELAQSIKKMV